MGKPTIIFDFDGTIADTFPVVLDIFHKVSRRSVALTAEEAKLLRRVALRQVKGKAMLRHAAELHIPWWHVPFLFLVCRELLKGRMKDVSIFPEMHRLITELHEAGYTLMVLSSNSTTNITVFLKKEHLHSYFSYIYGGVRSGRKTAVLRRLHERSPELFEGAWLIGDESRDMRAARLGGLHSCAVLWGYNEPEQLADEKPTATVETPAEIKAIFDRLLERHGRS